MDKELKILKRYQHWNNPATEDEIQNAIKAGIMYSDIKDEHDELVSRLKQLAQKISIEDTVNAFLYSLSTRQLVYRTALASLIWARSLPEHVCSQQTSRGCCSICGASIEESQVKIERNYYNRYRHFAISYNLSYGVVSNLCYALYDLEEFEKLPRVSYTQKDIDILNRILGLSKELTKSNKIIALQQFITKDKCMMGNKDEIYMVLGVLSIVGVFDTEQHFGFLHNFTPQEDFDLEGEMEIYYPLNKWRGKYGINYKAIEEVFLPVVGDALSKKYQKTGFDYAKTVQSKKVKKSNALQCFKSGEYSIKLTNEQRYYYGLKPINSEWHMEERFSSLYYRKKRSQVFFEGNVIVKMIYEECYENTEKENVLDDKIYEPLCYEELDYDLMTENRVLLLPLTSRGKKKPWTTSLLYSSALMSTPVYAKAHLSVDFHQGCVSCFNHSNDQYIPLPIFTGKMSKESFSEYTHTFIRSLTKEYDNLLDIYIHKKRKTVKFGPGDIFRVPITTNKCTYGLIIGKIRDIEHWEEIPKEHPFRGMMAQPIMYRQYEIFTDNFNMTAEELSKVPLQQLHVAQDNFILWETYYIIGHKKLVVEDIDLGFCYSHGKVIWGTAMFDVDEKNMELFEKRSIDNMRMSLSLFINTETDNEEDRRIKEIQEHLAKQLHLPEKLTMDDVAKIYGGMTRQEYVNRLETGNDTY